MTAVAVLHRDEIINRVAQGEYLATIATSLGLSRNAKAISNALAADPEYQAAREIGLEAKLATREETLESAAPLDVPRARELLSHARWRAEREAPHRWGPKQEIKSDSTITIQVVRYADPPAPGRVLDAVAQSVSSAIGPDGAQ